MAFPKIVLQNKAGLVESIVKICKDNEVQAIIIGDSRNYNQEENDIMERAHEFKRALMDTIGVPVYLEPEFMSSAQAEIIQGKNDMHDASAAAIILQSYLDKQKFKK